MVLIVLCYPAGGSCGVVQLGQGACCRCGIFGTSKRAASGSGVIDN